MPTGISFRDIGSLIVAVQAFAAMAIGEVVMLAGGIWLAGKIVAWASGGLARAWLKGGGPDERQDQGINS